MKAIVIWYTGETPSRDDIRTIAATVNDTVQVCVMKEDIINMLPIKEAQQKEEVDINQAAMYIAGLTGSSNPGRICKVVIDYLNKYNVDRDEVSTAFEKACKILSTSKEQLSERTVKKTGITKATRTIITDLYNAWKNG